MTTDHPEFIKCAMEAFETGTKARDIFQECACRLEIPVSETMGAIFS